MVISNNTPTDGLFPAPGHLRYNFYPRARPKSLGEQIVLRAKASVASQLNRGPLRLSPSHGTTDGARPFAYMPHKEQQMLRNAVLKEIGRELKHELEPDKDAPDRLRELVAQLEANAPPNDE